LSIYYICVIMKV